MFTSYAENADYKQSCRVFLITDHEEVYRFNFVVFSNISEILRIKGTVMSKMFLWEIV